MFIDIAKISIQAGDGGNGAIHFHREKYVNAGGPDGGDGGSGGNIVFVVDEHLTTLVDFKYKRKYLAENGAKGMGKNCTGKNGQDLIIKVPRGTLVRDAHSGLLIKDMSDVDKFVAAKGGRGGWGNARFATPTRQAPRFAKNGSRGEGADVQLELKLLADVGLVGFPNVGKSTLLSVISSARPKIANYHFTTLTPQLGVVSVDEGVSYVVADIPGLIEGASEGVGLGHAFLRHVERCRMTLHVVDISGSEGRNPIDDYEKINQELSNFSEELSKRPQIVIGNKTDIVVDDETTKAFRDYLKERDVMLIEISAATRQGIDKLLKETWDMLRELPPILVYESETDLTKERSTEKVTEIRLEDGVYYVEGEWLYNVLAGVNYSDYESLQYLHRVLRKNGVYELLEAKGIKEGDTVSIYDIQFDYIK